MLFVLNACSKLTGLARPTKQATGNFFPVKTIMPDLN